MQPKRLVNEKTSSRNDFVQYYYVWTVYPSHDFYHCDVVNKDRSPKCQGMELTGVYASVILSEK